MAHVMPADETLPALIGRIYDAALDPGLWPQVLDDIACQFNSTCCHMFVADLDADEVLFAALNELGTAPARRFHQERIL
jgi:hypothetical protein